ncbi:MAG: hypothetical protein KA586_09465 [Candidatus Promineofilum sp.]|nr:hypothetical protein [Promineifilum sp.]
MASDTVPPRPNDGRRQTAYWLLLTTLLGLPLITPLLRWSSVACTHDGHLHYHRVAAMAHAWDNGIYLTRWLPDLAFGYGYPFFVYREAAPLYAVLLPFLAGLPLPAASNLFYAVTILLCGAFMFLWVRDLFGPRAALVSAVAYMAAPYVMVDALIRGNAPESLALPLFPFLLWVGRRWVLFGSVRSLAAGVLGLALLSISHNISTFLFAPVLLVYLAALALLDRGRMTAGDPPAAADVPRSSLVTRRLSRLLALLALGLGLAFFYTGGALLEMDEVTLEMSTTTRNNDWRYNFASTAEILGPVAAENPTLVNPPLLFRLGWAPLALAGLGLTGLMWIKGDGRRAREQRLHIILMAAGAAVFLFMALPLSRSLWQALPLIDFVQFPWRFVGRAALPVAFLAGVPFTYSRPQRAGRPTPATRGRRLLPVVLLAAAIVLLMLEAIPNLYPRFCREEPFPTILTVHAYERITGLVGVDPEGSYFPRSVQQRPAGSPLEADYAAGRTPQRFDASVLPAAAALSDVAYGRFGVSLTVDSPEPFVARYLSFAFPGWSARVDGRRVDIVPEDPTGLITFDVPAGTHEIRVDWGATPLRLALVGLSLLSAVGAVVVAVAAKRRPATASRRATRPAGRGAWLTLGLLSLGLLGVKLYVDNNESPLRRPAEPPVAHTAALQGGEMALNGFNMSRDRVPAGETVDIDLAWTAVAPPSVDYQSEIALVGPDGLAWSDKGTERPRVFEDAPPTRLWSPGEWGWDSREVRTLSGTPPGLYDIVLTLFDKATLAPVTLLDTADGRALGPTAVIGQIEIANPDTPPTFAPQYPAERDFPAWGLRLLGYNQDRAEATAGDSVLLTFFWECADRSLCERFTLRLVDETGAAAGEWRLPAVREGLPPQDWPAHGRLRGQHIVPLPAGLTSGVYRFYVEDFPLGQIAVAAPERTYDAPPLALDIDTPFLAADGTVIATLVGLAADSSSLPCPPVPCALPLVWRAETETATGYHVFVHLVDAAGNILAQSDTVPGGWSRPTTGWLPGEYVTDVHTLNPPAELPAGPLLLRVGLYDPASGERLRADGAEFVTIGD